MEKYKENRKAIEKMAVDIIAMEDSYDSSMRGVFLDTLVTEYVKHYGERFALMFNTIYDNQVEDYDDYGDIDVKVYKLKIVGEITDRKYMTDKMKKWDDEHCIYSAKAFLLEDCCGSSGMFIISEVTKQSKNFSDTYDKIYTVHQVKKIVDKIDLTTLSPHSEDCIVQWKFNKPYDELEIPNQRRMMYWYNKFKNLIDTIRTPYWQLTEGKN